MTWISECGGLMTLLQPSHPLCYAIRAIRPPWEARGTQRTCLFQDGRGPVGSQQSSHWARCTRPLTHGGSAPHVRAAKVETEGNKLGGINLDQTLPGLNPEDVAAVIISDDDETDFPIDTPQAASTQKVEPAWSQK